MTHDRLRAVIERYTPTMLDAVTPASPMEIARLETLSGALPESYKDFLLWLGKQCPFLDAEQLAYSPDELLELTMETPDIKVPDGFILIGIDKSGNAFDLHIRSSDNAIVRLSEYYDGTRASDISFENLNLESYLLTAYVRSTLVPSHPNHFAAALYGEDLPIEEIWMQIEVACRQFDITHEIHYEDFRFYGGDEFVLGAYHRPLSSVVSLYVGSLERSPHEAWYDLILDQWAAMRLPV